MSEISGPVLVTGASGFVGRHVVEQLSKAGYRVKALVRQVPKRDFDSSVELVIADLNQTQYATSLRGVAAVVHAALTDNLADEPLATSTLFQLSARAGVRKFVHLSSIAVYGNPPGGTITEDTLPIPSSDTYSRTKLAIEEALRAASEPVEITVLRLGCVYGPGGGWWTGGLLDQMRHGKVILVNNGTGTANLIHVSDVARIVELNLQRSGPPFEIFNVTDGAPVPWIRYFAELESLAGSNATVSMGADEARQHGRKWLRPSLVRRVLRKLTRASLVYPLDERGIENFASRAVYSNHKASTVLGFAPEYDLESGIETVRSSLAPSASTLPGSTAATAIASHR